LRHSTNTKIFLVTGCSTGIGRALAIALSDNGHTVYAGARNIATLDTIKTGSLIPITLDVTNNAHINAAINLITKQQNKLDILINNAGYGAMGPLVEMPMSQLKDQFETNVFAVMNLTQQCLPLLANSDSAQVVNIGSVSGITPTPFSGAYCASKAALNSLTDVIRMELAPFNIHAMTVYPGGVSSEFGSNANDKLSDTLIENSRYKAIVKAIEARAKLSSDSPTTPEQFSAELIKTMFKAKPNSNKRIGYGSTILPLMKIFLPTGLREKLMRKSYKLYSI
jgi:short-subunit dehydrogenase